MKHLSSLIFFITLIFNSYANAWTHGKVPSGFNGGLSEVNFGDVELMLLDYMKASQGWSTITGGLTPNPDPSIGFNFDANGYPRNIISGGVRTLMVIPNDAERSWADVSPGVGAYTMDWDGGGTVYISGFTLVSGSLTSSASSTGNTVTLRPTLNRPLVGVTAVTSSTDYPRNIRVYYTTDQADLNAGKVLSAKARERWASMKIGVMRFLNWQSGGGGTGNQNTLTNWASIKPTRYYSYAAGEIRTPIYAGVTSTLSTDHFDISFNDPTYGTAPAVDKQGVLLQWNANQSGSRSYLTFNGREDLICNAFGNPADPFSSVPNTGVPAINQYTYLFYDALLQCWINFSSGGASPSSSFMYNGVPPEIQLKAAVEVGAHPYFLIPQYAADAGTGVGALTDFASNLIDMVRAQAPSWVKPIIEPSNEWWNSAFYVFSWSNNRQLIRNGGARPGQTVAPFQVTSLTFNGALTVTGTASGTGGKVRLTVASTATLTTGEIRTITGILGTVEANGVWPITVVDGTHVDLDGSVFATAYVSGGSISGQTVMQVSGTLPPLGANIAALNNQPSGLSGFNLGGGYVTSVGASSFVLDGTPTGGSWAGNSSTATLTLVGSNVSVGYTVTTSNAIVLSTTGTLPAPLVAGTPYYVKGCPTTCTAGTNFNIAASPNGANINFSAGSQSGTHTGVQVIAMAALTQDYHNTYGMTTSNLGQLLASKYSASNPKTQTSYKLPIGVQGGIATYISSTVGSNPRATAKHLVITSGNPLNQAKLWATHITPANYFHEAARGSGAQETALSNAWNGTLFTAGIVNGTMTVASFQNQGTTNMAAGQVVFGYGLPAPFGASQVTIVSGPAGCTTTCTGTGVYILSDNTINVASGTQLYSGADYAAVQQYLDSSNGTQFVATISNGSGGSGNQMVVSSITPIGTGFNGTIYLNANVNGSPITAPTVISSQSSGLTGDVGTYIISRNHLVTTPTTFTADGSFGLQQVNINLTNWKTWAQGFGINKMLFYEGGYSSDYSTFNTNSMPKVDLLRFVNKWVISSPSFPTGTAGMLAANYAYCDALTDGTFTAEYPSSYYFDGRYPSNNTWSVWENIYFPLIPPQVQAITDYNN